MNRQYQQVPLGELLVRRFDTMEVLPLETYKRVTIRMYGGGISVRDVVVGSEINTKNQFYIHTGQFLLSKIDARNGAFGIVPDECDGAIITGNFWTFDVTHERLNISFLNYLTRTDLFVEFCIRASEGTTNRKYLREDRFLAQTIPLPPLDEQRRIVAHIDALAEQIAAARGLRHGAVEEAEAFIEAARREAFTSTPHASIVSLEDVCETIIDNLHSNPVYDEDGEYPCIRSSDVGWGELFLETARRTSEAEYLRRVVRGAPQSDDIVLVREGGGTGKAAVVEPDHIFSLGQRVMMLRPNQDLVLPRFMLNQMLSPLIFNEQIMPQTKGSASPHLNISALRKFSFVLPSLEEQQEIVDLLDELVLQSRKLKRLQVECAAELDALLPSLLDRAFRGNL